MFRDMRTMLLFIRGALLKAVSKGNNIANYMSEFSIAEDEDMAKIVLVEEAGGYPKGVERFVWVITIAREVVPQEKEEGS
jgi:hypothetical protein